MTDVIIMPDVIMLDVIMADVVMLDVIALDQEDDSKRTCVCHQYCWFLLFSNFVG